MVLKGTWLGLSIGEQLITDFYFLWDKAMPLVSKWISGVWMIKLDLVSMSSLWPGCVNVTNLYVLCNYWKEHWLPKCSPFLYTVYIAFCSVLVVLMPSDFHPLNSVFSMFLPPFPRCGGICVAAIFTAKYYTGYVCIFIFSLFCF